MDLLIAADTVAYSARAVAPTVGTPGWASAGDPGASPPVPPTQDPAYQINALMEELTNVIMFDGTPLDRTNNAQVLQAIRRMFRTRVIGGTLTFYVSTTGSDSNDGLTAGTPLATIQRAITLAAADYDLTGTTVQIALAAGTYAGVSVDGSIIRSKVRLVGAGSGTTTIAGVGASGVSSTNGAVVTVSGLKVTSSGTGGDYTPGGVGLFAQQATILVDSDFIMGACGGPKMWSVNGAQIGAVSPAPGSGISYTDQGSAQIHWYASSGGSITFADATITLFGAPAYSTSFAVVDEGGSIGCWGLTFPGSATGPRYYANGNGTISTHGAGANYLPGSTAGSYANGGAYY